MRTKTPGPPAPAPAFALPLAAAAVIALLGAAGCGGGPPGDLFVVTRSGSIPGAKLTLRLIDDGGASCNGGARHDITSEQLIEARELRRELDGDDHAKDEKEREGLARQKLNLPPGRVTTLSYRVRSEEGTVAFSDTSAHQPQTFYRIAKLTRDVARQSCGLAR